MGNGGPAPEAITNAIFANACKLTHIKTVDGPDVDLSKLGETNFHGVSLVVFDPVLEWANLQASLFDFDAIRAHFRSGFRAHFDAMNAVTGPYAKRVLEDMLGAAPGTAVRATPLQDFGGAHPDPNPVYAHDLVETMFSPAAPDFGAASDGDGDRNMIVGRNCKLLERAFLFVD